MTTPLTEGGPSGLLTAKSVQKGLKTKRIGKTIHVYDQIDSTNTVALAWAEKGAPEGTVILADSQTHGRGRMGRQWISPPKVNLYLSIILRPEGDPRPIGLWSLAAAVAVGNTIQQTTGLPARLKWPNDILVHTKKVSGLLLESAIQTGRLRHLVLGIGLNVNLPRGAFPDEIRDSITSLQEESGRKWDRIEILKRLLEQIELQQESVRTQSPDQILDAYSALSETLGMGVTVQDPEMEWTGEAVGFTAEGALILKPSGGGPKRILQSGNVVHMRRLDAARD